MSPNRVQPEKRSSLYWAFSDFGILIKRSMVYIIRNMDQMLSTLFMPIMFLLMFRYVFGGAIQTPGINYVNFLFVGILVQNSGFGATYSTIGIANDVRRGVVDRFKSLPMVSSAVLVGHTVTDLARNVISAIIMVLVGLLVGFRPEANVWEWILALGLLLLFTFAFSWLSAIFGLVVKSLEGAQWITFVFIFPLTMVSSAFVPPETMPGPIRAFAENQPVTHVVDAMRSLLVGTPMGDSGWLAVIWMSAILVVSYIIASILFRRKATSN